MIKFISVYRRRKKNIKRITKLYINEWLCKFVIVVILNCLTWSDFYFIMIIKNLYWSKVLHFPDNTNILQHVNSTEKKLKFIQQNVKLVEKNSYFLSNRVINMRTQWKFFKHVQIIFLQLSWKSDMYKSDIGSIIFR